MTLILGHDRQAQVMLSAARGERMHHGWILAGPSGVGKGRFARELAMRLLSEAAAPMGSDDDIVIAEDHPTRRLIEAGSHPDYAELAPLEKDGITARNINVDQVRGLQRLIQSAPSLSTRRVVVIDAADDLERGAGNALLKTLEEPPADMIFLLVSHAPGRLLPTIRSRCRTIRFEALDDLSMREALKAAAPGLTAHEVDALVRVGGGSPGKALRYAGLELQAMEQALADLATHGDAGYQRTLALVKALSPKSAKLRYDAFLERAPAFIAQVARSRQGAGLGDALAHWEKARQLAGGAVILSLDPASVIFGLASHVAALAPQT